MYLFNDFIDHLTMYYPPDTWSPTLKKRYRHLAAKVFSDDTQSDL